MQAGRQDQVLGVASGRVVLGDNLDIVRTLPDASIDLIYVDPPFNTGKRQSLRRIKTVRDEGGDRVGFQGRRYRTEELGQAGYDDVHDDYLAFLEPRLIQFRRALKASGTLYFHIDYREVHYCKVLLDRIFGRACFLNELIWAYDYGARTRRKWPPKHDNILVYVRDPDRYYFDPDAAERIPYLAPGLVDAAIMRRSRPSGFCVGYPVFSRPVGETIVCHQTSVGSLPRSAFSFVTRPGAM